MVKHPDDYPWSSHGCYLGRKQTAWLTTDWVLGQSAATREKGREIHAERLRDMLPQACLRLLTFFFFRNPEPIPCR